VAGGNEKSDAGLEHELKTMLGDVDGVTLEESKNHLSCQVGRKMFAYTQGGGLSIKLPASQTTLAVESGRATQLVMGDRTMKEWIHVSHPKASDYQADMDLLLEAIAFARGS
jgi:hypothetical protein